MHVASTLAEYESLKSQWRGSRIALVPTMGALHEGHASLIRMATRLADIVVVSIFVNPLQFGPQEDLAQYPRPKQEDLALCEQLGVSAVFYPTVDTLYPDGLTNVTTVVPPESLVSRLCGAFRPGHFTGVATVVLKLFNVIQPQVAIFGEKDAQQVMVIRKMVRDLCLSVDIAPHPTVREADGLALSSRNRYLKSSEERQAALCLSQILQCIREQALSASTPLPAKDTLANAYQRVLAEHGPAVSSLITLQYLEAVDAADFTPQTLLTAGVKILIAAMVDEVRLIDNMDI
jgi:pantoate--beta-alanine ligase